MIAEALRYADDPNAPRVEGTGDRRRGSRPAAARSPGARRIRRVLMTGVSYMIPFVAAGGLLIALGFLFGGYEIVGPSYGDDRRSDNTLFNLPDAQRSASTTPCSAARASSPTSARCSSSSARRRSVPGPRAGRLHRLRDRRPARHRPGFVMGGLAANLARHGLPQRRLPRRHHRRRARRRDRPLDRQLEGAGLGARPDAGRW